jgi:hypothetical protein
LLQGWPFLFVTGLQNLAQRNKITDHSRWSHHIIECSHLMSILSAMNFCCCVKFLEWICPETRHSYHQVTIYSASSAMATLLDKVTNNVSFLLGTPNWIHKFPQSCGSV